MIFNETLHLVEETHVSDGMGGQTTVKDITSPFKAIVVDLPINTTLTSNRLIKVGTKKVITKYKLPEDAFSFVNSNYMELRINSLQKVKNHYVYLVEEVGVLIPPEKLDVLGT